MIGVQSQPHHEPGSADSELEAYGRARCGSQENRVAAAKAGSCDTSSWPFAATLPVDLLQATASPTRAGLSLLRGGAGVANVFPNVCPLWRLQPSVSPWCRRPNLSPLPTTLKGSSVRAYPCCPDVDPRIPNATIWCLNVS
jgi:hypothetical protein